MNGRLAGNPEIDLPAGDALAEMSILRGAGFGDIHARQYLDPAAECWPGRFVQRAYGTHQAIDSVTNAQAGAFWFKVQVGGVFTDRVSEQGIEKTDSG